MATIQGRAPAVVTWGTNVINRMSPRMRYTIRRIFTFFLVIWVAASLNFFLPRLAPGRDPVRERLGALQATGGSFQEGINEMVEAYQAKFGLDEPLWKQYFRYLGDAFTFDFGYSLQNYPATVRGLILDALPWTLGLLLVSTLLAFTIGTFAGALLGWERAPKAFQYLLAPFLTLSSIPYYLLGIILVYYFAFKVRAFPLSGGYDMGAQPEWSVDFALDVLNHSFLPAVSIILAQIGFWSLGMRAMMVTVQGEDYMTLAEAKGLRPFVIFLKYGARNALLPQTTSLALALGTIVSQAILVEVVFGYPGIGTLLYRAIGGFDYFLIYGIVLVIIVAIGLTTLILDLIYPFLDPRITYERR